MKVCMLAYAFYDSDGRIRRYAETLVNEGNHVDAICLRSKDQTNQGDLSGVHVHRIQYRVRNEKSKWSYLLKLVTFFFKSSYYITKLHLHHKYDVIHVHSVPDFEVFATLIPKVLGCRIILDIHDIVPEFYASKFRVSHSSSIYRILLVIEKLSIKFSNHVIIANDIWFEKLTKRSVSPQKCTSMINYPDPNVFYPRERKKTGKEFIMLYPGTLNEHQGIDIILLAINNARLRLKNFQFHIYGDGSEKHSLQTLTHDLSLQNIVIFHDMLPIEKIAEKMAVADMGIVAKKKNSFGNEAFSTKILEFMTQGVPMVVADTTIDQYYFNSDVVKFFRSEDSNDLEDSIFELYSNDKLRDQIAKEGRRFVQNYSWESKKHLYLDILKNLVN